MTHLFFIRPLTLASQGVQVELRLLIVSANGSNWNERSPLKNIVQSIEDWTTLVRNQVLVHNVVAAE